jgi:thiol-disulfide isomerase/thioredoxin
MRKVLGTLGIAAAALYVVAQSGSGLLGNYAKTLNSAQSLEATYTFQRIGGTKNEFTIQLAKPNMVRIDRANELIVGDGKNITTYDKVNKTYFIQPMSAGDLKAVLSADEYMVWASFFNGDLYAKTPSKSLGSKSRKGTTLQAVEMAGDATGKKVVTLYLGSDNIVRQADILLNDPNGRETFVLDAKAVKLNGVDANLFAFKAPEGARQLTAEELNSNKWYTDLEEAKKVAARTNRKIFVDFMATWCGPCKMLEHDVLSTEEFKKMSKQIVFVQIDVDQQRSVMQQYGVTAMPTQMVLNPDGSVVSKTVGYGGAAAFYQWLNGALGQ